MPGMAAAIDLQKQSEWNYFKIYDLTVKIPFEIVIIKKSKLIVLW